ncbi:hypothetical protein SAMN06298216_1652 [Spirosomataceae bacterium TFI 002]|nr:hypothetical protein SAMN06298216_1652 [Spirosomataceae bacterium TFI 002]
MIRQSFFILYNLETLRAKKQTGLTYLFEPFGLPSMFSMSINNKNGQQGTI